LGEHQATDVNVDVHAVSRVLEPEHVTHVRSAVAGPALRTFFTGIATPKSGAL
jgi:hypothetical protein